MKKIDFKNLPDTSTPINSTNLNQVQDNIEEVFNGNESMGSIVVEDITCKNLLSPTNIIMGIYLIGDGTYNSSSTACCTLNRIEIDNSKNYVLSTKNTQNSSYMYVMYYDANGTYLGYINTPFSAGSLKLNNFSNYANAKYINFRFDVPQINLIKPQLEKGSVATNYVEHKEFTLPSYASSVGNAIFTKYGHLVIVSGWFILNGSEATFTAPYKPTSQCWFPTNGVLASVDASGVSGFGIIYPDNGNIMIKMSGAITYCTTGFCYYTND